jgi:hypothetical protein
VFACNALSVLEMYALLLYSDYKENVALLKIDVKIGIELKAQNLR